jgi:hypothetical protein
VCWLSSFTQGGIVKLLKFKSSDLVRVIDHAFASKEHRRMYGAKEDPVPGMLLVHGQGVYIMSNGIPADTVDEDKTGYYTVHAEGCDPDKDEDWWETSMTLVGGDDFWENLPFISHEKWKVILAKNEYLKIRVDSRPISIE